jgi:hypothetical protein
VGSSCRFERNDPGTVYGTRTDGVRRVRMGDSDSDGVGYVGGWVGGWVGYVTVGIARYRSLKMDPFASSCVADCTGESK